MRRVLSIICGLILMLLIPAAWLLSGRLPADPGGYIAQKYAGWNGVLQAWVCCEWECGGSFMTWLNRCAARFEKQHEGVYIEFTPVPRQAMRAGGIRPPQMLLHSPGVISDPSGLAELGFPDSLRGDLRLDARAVPVAMGGTIWAVNPGAEGELLLPTENHAPGVIGLLSGGSAQIEIQQPGLDLGLEAFAQEAEPLERFMAGELGRLPVNAGELAQLARLRESGRGPNWRLEPAGEFACADQLLYISALQEDGEILSLCREFARLLLDDESQASLAGIGAFAVNGRSIYPGHDPRSSLDALLNSVPLAAKNPFSEHSAQNAAAIVRAVREGTLSPFDAAARFGFEFSLPNHRF